MTGDIPVTRTLSPTRTFGLAINSTVTHLIDNNVGSLDRRLWLHDDHRLGSREPNVLLIGVNYHPSFQTIAFLIWDNGPQFIARDFREFIRISGMTHVGTSASCPHACGCRNPTMSKTRNGSKDLDIAAAYHYPTLRDQVIGHYAMRVTLRMPERTVAKKNEATIVMLLLLVIMLFPPSMLVIIPWFLIQGSRRPKK